MLFLVFHLDRDRYALEATQIVEILPLLHVKRLPLAPAGIAGVIDYRGQSVPVVDLAAMAIGRSSHARLSTRIVLVRYVAQGHEPRLLGLIVERATQAPRYEACDFEPIGVDNRDARWLGPVARDASGIVQRVEIAELLTPEVAERLIEAGTARHAEHGQREGTRP